MLFVSRAIKRSKCYFEIKRESVNDYLYSTFDSFLISYFNTHRISSTFMIQRYSSTHYSKFFFSNSSSIFFQIDEDIEYQNVSKINSVFEKKSTFVDVSDYYRAIKSIIEIVSFNRLRELNEFFFTISIFIDRFFKAFVTIKKTMFRKRSFVKRKNNFNFEIFFNHSKFQFMFDHSKFFINKNKNKKRRFLLFTQFFVQNFQNENFNQIINIEFFWNSIEKKSQNIRTNENFLNLIQNNLSIVLNEHNILIQNKNALKTQLKNMKQIISILNHQYQIDDVKLKTIIDETHKRFIQQIFKIVNLKNEIKNLFRKIFKISSQLQNLNEYIVSHRSIESSQIHIISFFVLTQRLKTNFKIRLYDWQNDSTFQFIAQFFKRIQLNESYFFRHFVKFEKSLKFYDRRKMQNKWSNISKFNDKNDVEIWKIWRLKFIIKIKKNFRQFRQSNSNINYVRDKCIDLI